MGQVISMVERRRLARRAVDAEVQIQQGDLLITGRATDYSALGLRFEAGQAYANGEFLEGADGVTELNPEAAMVVTLLSNSGRPAAVFQGSVRWIDGAVCGIQNLSIEALEPERMAA